MANFSIFVPLIYHIPMTFGVLPSFSNKTFYRYDGYFELMRFKECYRMPRSHVHDSIYSLPIYARFSDQSSLSFPRKRLSWEKKIVVPCLDVTIAFFPRNMPWKTIFTILSEYNGSSPFPLGIPLYSLNRINSNEHGRLIGQKVYLIRCLLYGFMFEIRFDSHLAGDRKREFYIGSRQQ